VLTNSMVIDIAAFVCGAAFVSWLLYDFTRRRG